MQNSNELSLCIFRLQIPTSTHRNMTFSINRTSRLACKEDRQKFVEQSTNTQNKCFYNLKLLTIHHVR